MSVNHDSNVYTGGAFIFPAAVAKAGLTIDVAAGSKNVFVTGLTSPGDLKKTVNVGDRVWILSSKEMREITSISYSNNVMIVDRPFAAPVVAEALSISVESLFNEVSITNTGVLDVTIDFGDGFNPFKPGYTRVVDKPSVESHSHVSNFVVDTGVEDVVISYTK
jgi:hypothetical protein